MPSSILKVNSPTLPQTGLQEKATETMSVPCVCWKHPNIPNEASTRPACRSPRRSVRRARSWVCQRKVELLRLPSDAQHGSQVQALRAQPSPLHLRNGIRQRRELTPVRPFREFQAKACSEIAIPSLHYGVGGSEEGGRGGRFTVMSMQNSLGLYHHLLITALLFHVNSCKPTSAPLPHICSL